MTPPDAGGGAGKAKGGCWILETRDNWHRFLIAAGLSWLGKGISRTVHVLSRTYRYISPSPSPPPQTSSGGAFSIALIEPMPRCFRCSWFLKVWGNKGVEVRRDGGLALRNYGATAPYEYVGDM